jgi:hypothetical protein
MYLSNQSLLVILIVGTAAGWLADRVLEGGGFGIIGDDLRKWRAVVLATFRANSDNCQRFIFMQNLFEEIPPGNPGTPIRRWVNAAWSPRPITR